MPIQHSNAGWLACLALSCACGAPTRTQNPQAAHVVNPDAPASARTGTVDQMHPVDPVDLIDLAEWRRRILPTPDELGWTEIPWLASFAEGVHAARDVDRPLLLWAMNGHPLGCT